MGDDNTEYVQLEVRHHKDETPTLTAIYGEEGFVDPELQTLVEQAIRRYPNQDARMWVGGVAAIRVVNDWLLRHSTNGS